MCERSQRWSECKALRVISNMKLCVERRDAYGTNEGGDWS